MMQRSLARNARVGVVFSGDAPTVRPVASSAGRRRGCCAVAARAPLANDDAPSASSPRISQLAHSSSSLRRRGATFSLIVARAAGDEGSSGSDGDEDEKIEFGYTRKDVLLIGAGVFALGYAMYYGLQAAGVEQGMAGNYVQLIIFCALCFGWVGSYLWRVASKNMSYAKQLEQYEEAVMAKRLEEMPEAERARLLAEAEEESAAAAAAAAKGGGR